MFVVNEDLSIYATRGDIVFFKVTAEDDGKAYTFKAGDVVRVKIYGRKDAETVLMQKDFPVIENTGEVEIFLAEEDTKFGDVISKPTDFWYEVELNPGENPQTIIGYDEDGAKVFRLFPEGDDVPPYEPKPEDFPVVDEELDLTSSRPVANSAIAKELAEMRAECDATFAAVGELHVTPQMFGAVGDGVADDTEAIQQMFESAESGNTIFFPVGEYLVNSFGTRQSGAYGYYGALLYQKENITVRFAKGAVLKSVANDDNANFSALLGIVECSNIKVFGGELVGELDEHTFASETDTTTFTQSGVWVSSSSNIVVDSLTSHNFIAGCIYVGGTPHSDTVEIRNCLAYHSHYHAIVVEGADNVKILNTAAYDANTNRDFGTSIDVEGISTEDVNTNITIDGCYFGEAEAGAININKCKDVHIRHTRVVGAKLTIQPSENVFVSGCYLDGAKLHILQGGSKNIVVDGNKLHNNNVQVQIYASDSNVLENVVIRNNTVIFDTAFEDETYGIACFQVQGQGRAAVSIVDNVCKCVSGRVMFVKATGGSGSTGITMSGNKFTAGSTENEVTMLYRDLFSLSNLGVHFVGNEIELHLADDAVAANGNSTSTVINLMYLTPNGTEGFAIVGNDIRIYGDTATAVTALNLLNSYTELAEAPEARYVDFLRNNIYSEVPATCGLTVPVGYKTRVYRNIVTSGLAELISESQSGVTTDGNICDTVV